MHSVFVVESEGDLCCDLGQYLGQAGYSVRTFSGPADVIPQAERLQPSLLVIDSILRSGNGLELCRRIRRNTLLSKTPVILLTHRAEDFDRIAGLEAGADDCIMRPFSSREFLARVQAVLRRYGSVYGRLGDIAREGVMQLGEIEIDALAMRLSVAGKDVGATTLEFRLIQHLARNQGRVFTRDELLDAVWGNTEFVTPRSVDTCVRRLRKKIESGSSTANQLRTVRGVGYRLDGQINQPGN